MTTVPERTRAREFWFPNFDVEGLIDSQASKQSKQLLDRGSQLTKITYLTMASGFCLCKNTLENCSQHVNHEFIVPK